MRDTGGAIAAADRARELADGAPVLRAVAAAQGAMTRMTAGRRAEGRELLRSAAAVLQSDEADAAPFEFRTMAAQALMWIDDHEGAERILTRIVDSQRAQGAAGALPYPLATLAQLDLRRGRWNAALANATEAVSLGREGRQGLALAIALGSLAWVEAYLGDEAAAREHAAGCDAVATDHGAPAIAVYADVALGALALGRGDAEEAIRQHERAAERSMPGNLTWAPDLIEAYHLAGRDDDARRLLDRLPSDALPEGAPPLVARCEALLAGDDAFAARFEQALELHRAVPAPFEEARTRLLYGERLQQAGRDGEARSPLLAALGAFEGLGATPMAGRARRALRAAGAGAPKPTTPALAPLSPHELQVALLVAEGRTNRETAEALFLSPKTVEHHLGQIFRKLGLKRRTELARLVAAS
jgi:DNA-binding CsgD family transcriptional regulator